MAHREGFLLILEYAGWTFEAVGGVLLGWEALFKQRDHKMLEDKIAVMTDKAFAGIKWDEGGHIIDPHPKEGLKSQLSAILNQGTQNTARWGFVLLLAGLIMHAVAKVDVFRHSVGNSDKMSDGGMKCQTCSA